MCATISKAIMENFYLVEYIKNNFKIDRDILDSIKYELDQSIYYYGNHFKYPREKHGEDISANIKHLLFKYLYIFKVIAANKSVSCNKKNIISNAYFNFNQELEKIGYGVYKPFGNSSFKNVINNLKMYFATEHIKDLFKKETFRYIIDDEFMDIIRNYKIALKDYYIRNGINAIVVPYDMPFFENVSLKIFKEISRPSFVFLHGLPGRYNNVDENRADYLIVWGEKIKENYIKAGISGDKIFVSGHPYYKKWSAVSKDLKFNFENILVITKSLPGAQQSDMVRLCDRGNSILYLYSIENVLKKMGIKSVRLRLHPSENNKWYSRFIDTEFYKIDSNDLADSLIKSTLVIGPSSTALLESVYYRVNYLVYEPSEHNVDLINYELVPPFDGSDVRIPVAKNESQLEDLLKKKISVDSSCFTEYIKTPFDIGFIRDIV